MSTSSHPVSKPSVTKRSAWAKLGTHYKKMSKLHLRQLFADDPSRGERLVLQAIGFYFDYSKNRINDETLKLLVELANEAGLPARIEAIDRKSVV